MPGALFIYSLLVIKRPKKLNNAVFVFNFINVFFDFSREARFNLQRMNYVAPSPR